MLGSIIRRLLTDELLIDLQSILQSIDDNDNVASPVVDYMRALWELYHIYVAHMIMNKLLKSSCLFNFKNEGFIEFWSEDNLH